MRKRVVLILAACWMVGTGVANAQVNLDAFRDYFLVGRFGELCTMCEAVAFCTEGAARPDYAQLPEVGNGTLYFFQTRTFWSQIATIGEWFMANFTSDALAVRGHARPVQVYDIQAGHWSGPRRFEARLVLEPGVIELDDRRIDRVSRAWQSADGGRSLGFCQRLPLWDSLEVIAAKTGGTS